MRELIFTDEKYIRETTEAIAKALTAQQYLLDCWNSLNVGECGSLFRLIHDPNGAYRDAYKSVNEVPAVSGKYKVSENATLDITEIPVPNQLYTLARETKKAIMIGHRDLWSIQDGKTVVLNEILADNMIHSHDIYVENEAQRVFAQRCINYVESGTYLFEKLQGMVTMKGSFVVPFSLTGRAFSFINALALEPEALREMLKMIK